MLGCNKNTTPFFYMAILGISGDRWIMNVIMMEVKCYIINYVNYFNVLVTIINFFYSILYATVMPPGLTVCHVDPAGNKTPIEHRQYSFRAIFQNTYQGRDQNQMLTIKE